jgi:hypothetical protein
MVNTRLRLLLRFLVLALPMLAHGGPENPCLACDRQMRKTFEAIQAWRRSHNGSYPGRLVDLEAIGLLPNGGEICPELLGEHSGSSATRNETSSRGPQGDPAGTYEYEMSDRVLMGSIDRMYLPEDAPDYTRQQIKCVLLRRPFFEQVPILRCTSHEGVAPPAFADKGARRNLTVEGNIYWSGLYWEQLWLDDAPYCARQANVLFGSQGPPFHTDVAPALASALDLRNWSCSFGDHPWWWTYPMFEQGSNRQKAAHLRPFFQEAHGRVLKLNDEQWWIDGLVQLQGRIKRGNENIFNAPGMEAFVWKKTGTTVGRPFREAAWLQGTVWTAKPGETAGWLVWHYADGSSEHVPIVYGRNTARFWGEPKQLQGEKDFVEPVWRHHETKEEAGRERWLRLYRQEWVNPRPDALVATLDFVSNPECRASPFLIAVNVFP